MERQGVSVYSFCSLGMALFVVTQILMVLRVPLPPVALLAAYGIFGGTGILSYAVMAEYFPTHMIGYAHTTLTLVLFLLVFGLQVGIGAMLSQWPVNAGRYPASAHLTVWWMLVALQVASAVWYVLPSRAAAQDRSRGGNHGVLTAKADIGAEASGHLPNFAVVTFYRYNLKI